MNIIGKINRKELIIHISFWFLYLILRIFFVRIYWLDLKSTFFVELLEMPLKLMSVYYVVLFIPYFLVRNKYFSLVAYTTLFVLVVTFLKRIVDYYGIYPILEANGESHEIEFWNYYRALRRLIYILPATGTASALYFIRSWYLKIRQNEKLIKEKIEAELNFLKSQIHPHFLFNTLNNLYALSLNESKKVPELILKLSKILNYMLYECNAPLIPLNNEIELIKNYIELERLRHGDRVEIMIDITGETKDKMIPPLLFISFVENSFKHGIDKDTGKGWISLYIFINESTITFQLQNSLSDESIPKVINAESIGLSNVKKRLKLLYHDKYKLKISREESFMVFLELDSGSNKSNN